MPTSPSPTTFPPTGALTFLFTDIEDSTRLWQAAPEAMQAALARHDAILRHGIETHEGHVFKTAGDAFYAAFATPRLALGAALAVQHTLLAETWPPKAPIRVRMALHSGAAEFRDGDYFGSPVNVVARLLSVSRGGQTLLSAALAAALDDASTAHAQLENHGHYRLKGVEMPVEVYELGIPGRSEFAPPADTDRVYRVVRAGEMWQPVRAIRHNLPAERDAFVGRKPELYALAQRLDARARLTTVVGPAGTGKTRLVRRYGRAWLGDWPGGVYFCDLSEARSLDGVFFAVAVALDVPLGKGDPGTQLGHAIANRGRCLVLLDNFEQITEHAPATVGRWLDQAVDAAFVVTSRERLHLPGEEIFPLEPLPLAQDALDLFAARARAQRPEFVLTEANRAAVAEVVRLLDGLPLAIELAAARVRVFSPAQLVERLRDRFQLLAGARGVAARQATLKAAIDWSWDLLAPWEQATLGQCSVFEGGFTLEAAEAVLDLSRWPEAPPAMDAVQALVDKSLVRTWVPGEQGRYDVDEPYFGMYLSIHDYATEKLEASRPGATSAAHTRHGGYFARFGSEEALEALVRHGGVKRRHALALELDNLIAACRRAVARDDSETSVATYRAAWEVLEMQGPFTLAVALGEQVLALDGIAPAARAVASWTRALVAWRNGRLNEAEKWLEQALALSRQAGDRRREGSFLGSLGNVYQEQGRFDEARKSHSFALAIHREFGDRRAEGTILGNLANAHFAQGRLDEARAGYESSIAIHREVGNRVVEGSVLGNLAGIHYEQGRFAECLACCQQALAIHREVGDRRCVGVALGNLGVIYRDQGEIEDARTHFEEALVIHREMGDRHFEGTALGNLCGLHQLEGRMSEALTHCEAGLAILREIGNRFEEGIVLGNLGDLLSRQGRGDEAREAFRAGEAILREIGSKLGLVKLLSHKGQAEARAAEVDLGRSTLAEVETVAASMNAGPESELWREIAKLREALA